MNLPDDTFMRFYFIDIYDDETLPSVGASSPVSIRNVVVFPAPLIPGIKNNLFFNLLVFNLSIVYTKLKY